jgi:hypothetical protein
VGAQLQVASPTAPPPSPAPDDRRAEREARVAGGLGSQTGVAERREASTDGAGFANLQAAMKRFLRLPPLEGRAGEGVDVVYTASVTPP